MGFGYAHWHWHLAEAHGLAVGALEFGADAIAQPIAIHRIGGDQVPAQPVGQPGRQQQTLHRVGALHVEVELHHVVEGIAPRGWIKHHRQRFAPAAQPQPVEVVDRLARCNPVHQ